jgi:hypothetical protein
VSGPLHTVHVRVNDAASGQPTPVRIRFIGADGAVYAPFGRLTDFATGWGEDVGGNLLLDQRRYALIDGSCEIQLPTDPITIEISKGPEYLPLRQEVKLAPGRMALRFAVERWINLREQGWYSGDGRVHFLTPHAALLEAAAEDLAVVNLLAFESDLPSRTGRHPSISNILAFSGPQPAVERPGHLVVVNTLNTHPVLGMLGLLNAHRVVFPLSFGGRSGLDDWTLADWCDQCHRKGGLVVWAAFDHRGATPDSLAGEALADLILGKIDAVEVQQLSRCRDEHNDWYRLLNCGFRVPLVGASRKASNQAVAGSVRTYARLGTGEALSYKGWIEAVRAGRTSVTSGPLLSFTVNGLDSGATIEAATVQVRAEARSIVPFTRLELVANGQVVAGVEASGSPASALLEGTFEMPASGWLAARCLGQPVHGGYDADVELAAHASPVYVQVPGKPQPADPFTLAYLTEQLDRMLTWVKNEARCENDRQRADLANIFQSARQALLQRG